MPGLRWDVQSFTTPGIKGLLEKRPDIKRRVERVVIVSALRVKSGAKARSPVLTGRMKTSIVERPLGDDNLVMFVGTNVVSLPSGVRWSRTRGFRVRRGGKTSGGGYHYPRRQEFDTTLHHPTGEWGYLRKSLAQEETKFIDQSRRALVRGLKAYGE